MSDTYRQPSEGPPVIDRRAAVHGLVAMILGMMGLFFWAIRGTGGFGGSAGGLFAGLGWGLLWFTLARSVYSPRHPLATPRMIAAITLGIAYGGMTGYGVYVSWVKGEFYLDHPEGLRAISPWAGYGMLFLCGLHWGGVTGVLMSWTLPSASIAWPIWPLRIACGVLGGVVALGFVNAFPWLFLPFYDEGLYAIESHRTCQRALGSLRNIAPHVGLLGGCFAFELLRRDRHAVTMITIMALGFAIPFTIGAYWHTWVTTPWPIDWWKNWEMTIGLGGGLAMGLAFYLFRNLVVGSSHDPSRDESPAREMGIDRDGLAAALIGGGVPIWFAASRSIRNGIRGWAEAHGIDEAVLPYLAWPSWVGCVPDLLIVVALGIGVRSYLRGRSASPISDGLIGLILGLMVLLGFAVTLRWPMTINQWVLVTTYSTAIVTSLLAYRTLVIANR